MDKDEHILIWPCKSILVSVHKFYFYVKIDFPFSGFLLRNSKKHVLVNTGMKVSNCEQMIIGDVNPKGSTQILLDELAKENLTPNPVISVYSRSINATALNEKRL